ncbi:hypothetical protein [Halosolutus gelatinilyticus]|uniref:hypothetical protein n=1 Tax=Halosolutus gelatinilyticus TaxID=2931975 RepID=UPI001FF199BA|nr:hypothetical protein [Halosolutus gelatinilyticus]
MVYANRSPFVRDAVIATVILACLSGLTYGVQVHPLRIPGYILLIGFGTVGGAFGPRIIFPAVFGVYLVALGLIGAAVVRTVRRRMPEVHFANWRLGVASALGVTGVLSVLFAIVVLLGTSQTDAVLTTGLSGIVLLGLAAWFAGLFTINTKYL